MDEKDFKRLLDISAEETRRHMPYAELDRRMRTLEEGMADLQARVERLEQSTY